MRFEINDGPDFAWLRVVFERRDEALVAESGAMLSMNAEVTMETSMRGGFFEAAKRKILGGESLFQNTYRATSPGQELCLAPGAEGDIRHLPVRRGETVFLQSGAYLAHTGDLQLDGKVGGLKSFFGGVGFFMLKITGEGELFFNSYGALREIPVNGRGVVVDNGNLVAFTGGLDYRVQPFAGTKGLFFSGEGLVTAFSGQGTVWVQTRNAAALAGFLERYRRVNRRSN